LISNELLTNNGMDLLRMNSSEMDQQDRNQIIQAIQNGRKIEAIKIYRECTGNNLLEAKNFIEGLTEELREQNPESIPENNSGCGTAALICFICPALSLFYLLIS
tara:strand:+ start:174 stop:488 length:315 start_codon:yes stop_codon:yes gene_type:complete